MTTSTMSISEALDTIIRTLNGENLDNLTEALGVAATVLDDVIHADLDKYL